MIRLLDKPLADLKAPLWLRETIELTILLIVSYVLIKWALRQLVPLLASQLVKPAITLVAGTRITLLLPDFLITRTLFRGKAPPPSLVYFYGDTVLELSEKLEASVYNMFPVISNLRRIPRTLIFVALIGACLVWNSSYCATGESAHGCVSPTGQWSQSFTQWIDKMSAKHSPALTVQHKHRHHHRAG